MQIILDTLNKLNLKLIYTQTTLNQGKSCFQGGGVFFAFNQPVSKTPEVFL